MCVIGTRPGGSEEAGGTNTNTNTAPPRALFSGLEATMLTRTGALKILQPLAAQMSREQ